MRSVPSASVQHRENMQNEAEEIVRNAARARRDAGAAMDERVATAACHGRRKAAVLLVSLGSQGAAEVFRHLPNEMIEQLTVEMARKPTVEPEHASMVMEEMVAPANARGYIAEGGLRFAREVLEQSVGAQRAGEILNRLSVIIETTPFEFLRSTPPDQIAAFLRNEHPQTVAMVVAQLPNHAARREGDGAARRRSCRPTSRCASP